MSRFLASKVLDVNLESADTVYSADLSTDRTILAIGEIAVVDSVLIANSSNKPAEITFVDGATNLVFRETVDTKNSKSFTLRYKTSGGLVAEAIPGEQSTDVFINVFYLHPSV